MSRIGEKAVKVPSDVKVTLNGQFIKISSSAASLTRPIDPLIQVEYDATAGEIRVSRTSDQRQARAMHGTTRALIANMVVGVTKGFAKELRIYGTGYGIRVQGDDVFLSVGYVRPVSMRIPQGATIEIKAPNSRGNEVPAEFSVRGADRCTVGQLAADIRRVRPPEPYKGKGIRYADEIVKRKMGKAFTSGAT